MTDLATFARLVPAELLNRSGAVFYSGRAAFSRPSSLYLLGINPGGDPEEISDQTVGGQVEFVKVSAPEDWSSYRDERWVGKRAGTYGMQPRILHLCRRLDVNPGFVPASNLVFPRSRRETNLTDNYRILAERCWPFHETIIKTLKVRIVVCFGRTVGNFVRRKLDVNIERARFQERNGRRWESTIHASANGPHVATLTHPGIAAWNSVEADPTEMLAEYLAKLTGTAAR